MGNADRKTPAVRLPPETRAEPVPVGTTNILPPIRGGRATMPHCKGCGTTVGQDELYCETCAEKPHFKAMMETAAQPKPAYEDGGPPITRA